MPNGVVIESGIVGGKPYRIWQAHHSGKKIVYWGENKRKSGGVGSVRSLRWLRKMMRAEEQEVKSEQ